MTDLSEALSEIIWEIESGKCASLFSYLVMFYS